jgi:hypothetical protein
MKLSICDCLASYFDCRSLRILDHILMQVFGQAWINNIVIMLVNRDCSHFAKVFLFEGLFLGDCGNRHWEMLKFSIEKLLK